MYVVTFPISKELYTFFKKKRRPRFFKLYQALFICKKLAADDDDALGWSRSKIWHFRTKKADFSLIVNIFF